MLCVRCVLPESKPYIVLDEAGVCNLCRDHEKAKAEDERDAYLETDFTKMLAMHKGRGAYDCLVMCSGGKDSTAALYYMKKRYKLNPLAFTFDHGFEDEEALDNVRRAVGILGVDFLYFRSDYMSEMFSAVLKTGAKAVICHLCSIWYLDLTFQTAARYGIPVIIAGWTKGQSKSQPLVSRYGCGAQQVEFASMAKAAQEFLAVYTKQNPKYSDFPKSVEEALARARKRHRCTVLSPHWFLPFDSSTYVETIKRELQWEFPRLSYPAKTTNCRLNFVSVYNSMRHFGYTHYHVEMSKLIRKGLMTRGEALENLRIDFGKDLLNEVAQKLDYRFEGDCSP